MNFEEGLEEIGKGAFGECTSLHEISIPSADKAIKEHIYALLTVDDCDSWRGAAGGDRGDIIC